MPELGDPSGLVAGYSGPGAATVLPGGTQDPLAVLQQKKALAQKEQGQLLTSSKEATSQLKGAWDRDIPNLAGKRKAYLTLNSHWMQQGIDPRDPSNDSKMRSLRMPGSDFRRDGHRQGDHRKAHPRVQPTGRKLDRRHQLRES